MDPIQTGLVELEKQRKASAFNARVFWAALRESSIHFKVTRESDAARAGSLSGVLMSALEKQPPETRTPDYWSQRVADHVASLTVTSRFYTATISLMGVVTAYFVGDNAWWLSVTTGIILLLLTKAKWGLDKYCASLERIRNSLDNIRDQQVSEVTASEAVRADVQQIAALDRHSATLHGGK